MPLIIPGNSQASTGFTIDQSIRFNDDDSGRMGRTPSSASNRRTWTLSVWIKRGNLDSSGFKFIFSRTEASVAANIAFYQDSLYFSAASAGHELNLTTNRKFRDPSAWYHIIIAQDTTQAVSSERVRIYVNGQRETSFSTETYPALNYQGYINTAALHDIGVSRPSGSLSGYFDGYMAEIVLVDGQSLDSSNFGEYSDDGIWIPKDVSGLTFGTNGFHIKGEDSSDLGNDSSGNNNDYTPSGLAAHDQVLDSPTNNFCVISQINMGSATGVTLKNGGLEGTTGGTPGNMPASFSLDSGKWYWEVNNHANGSGNNFGVGETPTGSFDQFTRGSNGNTVNTNAKTTTGSSGQIIGFKLDFDAGTLTHSTDGTSYSSTGSLTADMAYAPHSRLGGSSGRVAFNFGQDSTFGGLETAGGNSDGNGVGNFYYSVPSGFLAICTKNLGS